MSEDKSIVTEDELHAYVDGQLEPDGLAAVMAWLRERPDDAAHVLRWQMQRLQLRRLAASIDLGATPAALTEVVTRAARQHVRRTGWSQAAAVALLIGASVTGGRYWGQAGVSSAPAESVAVAASPRFVQEAVVAHAVYVPEARHPVEVSASEESHLIQWLSRRLGAPLKAPSLGRFGYRLLGGRLLPGEGVPRAQFMYENPQGGRVTLYVAVFEPGQAPDSTSFRSVRLGDEESFYWIEDRFGYALNAKASGPDLQALAREVYTQLQR